LRAFALHAASVRLRRSLAKIASLYNKYNTEHSAPYWRSPIWINANFLTLQVSKPKSCIACPWLIARTEGFAALFSSCTAHLHPCWRWSEGLRDSMAVSDSVRRCQPPAARLQALHYYAGEPGPHADKAKEVYGKLRANVLNNIVRQYNTTGYLWENYDDETGRGKGSHPFTGCASCVYCSPTVAAQSICMNLLGRQTLQMRKHV
jgi:Glycosyl hydrolase family 63 C-terminal domain